MFKKTKDIIAMVEHELKLASTILLAAFLGGIIALLLTGCGATTKHDIRFSGTATVEQKITIDFSVCDAFPEEEQRLACIEKLLSVLEKKQEEPQ